MRATDALAPVTIVCGGTLLRPFERTRLAELLDGHINVRVITAAELALRLGEPPLARSGRVPIAPLADRALVRRVARGAEGYFQPVRDAPGFANALHRLFIELRSAGASPDELAASASGSSKLAGLAELYRSYGDARAPFYDAIDAMAAPDLARLDEALLLVHGIWEAPPLLRALLLGIAERIPVAVLLPVTGSEADDAHRALRDWLESHTAKLKEVEEPAALRSPLAPLHDGLLAAAPPALELGDRAVLLSAPDPVREAREAVRTCIAWAQRGVRLHEMAIAYRHGREYQTLIADALAEAGIAAYLHAGTPLRERPLGRQALALLELLNSNLPRAQVMQFLADEPLPEATLERYGGVPAPSWDELSRRAGVIEGVEQWRHRLGLLRDELADGRRGARGRRDAGELERLGAFIDELWQAIERLPDSATWSDHLDYLDSLLTTYVRDSGALRKALAPLGELDRLGRPVSGRHFLEVARATIDGLRLEEEHVPGQVSFARRGVNVVDVNSLRHLSFRAVVIVGLIERAFPPPPRQDPLLLDDEREHLSGIELPLRARGPDAEALQFALGVHAAGEWLQLSFARAASAGGRAQLPSRFFRDAAHALSGQSVRADRVDELAPALYRRIAAQRPPGEPETLATSVWEYDQSLLLAEPVLAVAVLKRRSAAFGRALEAIAARWRSPEMTVFDGVLSDAAAAALDARMGADRPLSPTALESYAECPYRFFLEKVLGLRELDEPETVERIDPLNRGSLIHHIFERFLSALGDERPDVRHRSEHLEQLGTIATEECDAAQERGLTGYPALWHHDRRSILEDLVSWYDEECEDPVRSRYQRAAFEVRFGAPRADEPQTSPLSVDQPIEIDAGGRRLRLNGRIDRLEWSGDGAPFRVIDYKTGGDGYAPAEDSVRGGRSLQLPLYLLAAAQLLDRRPQDGVAQYLYATRRGNFTRRGFSGGALGAEHAGVPELLASLLDGIRGGDFHAEPGSCRFCAFDRLCDSSRADIRSRKAADRRAIAFTERLEHHP